LHEQKLIEYIKLHGLEFPLTGISLRTGVDVSELKRVVKIHGLEGYISGRFDVAVQDLMNSEKHTYTIIALAKKHDVPYMALYKYLTSVGKKFLCFRPPRSSEEDAELLRILIFKYLSVVKLSREAKERGIVPCSRQGIYDSFEKHRKATKDAGDEVDIMALVNKKKRRLKNEQSGGSDGK